MRGSATALTIAGSTPLTLDGTFAVTTGNAYINFTNSQSTTFAGQTSALSLQQNGQVLYLGGTGPVAISGPVIANNAGTLEWTNTNTLTMTNFTGNLSNFTAFKVDQQAALCSSIPRRAPAPIQLFPTWR